MITCLICKESKATMRKMRSHLWAKHRTRPQFAFSPGIRYCHICYDWHKQGGMRFCDPKERAKQLAVWGKKGGKASSSRKLAASRISIEKARQNLLSEQTCKKCRKNKLGWGNRSGVCRACQRKPKG